MCKAGIIKKRKTPVKKVKKKVVKKKAVKKKSVKKISKDKKYTIPQLIKICKSKGIKGYSKMRKAELMKHCL